MAEPRISVIMAVYNAAPYLRAAIDSILEQTFGDFELILIDDASTDASWDIANTYTDPRMVRLRNTANRKAAITRNRGLAVARGAYIAPMDADDVSLPHRLATTAAYLDANPAVGLVSANWKLIDAAGHIVRGPILRRPYTHNEVTWALYWDSPVAHSTVMYRAEVAQKCGGYAEHRVHGTEDYALWRKMIAVTQANILYEVVMHYRRLDESLIHGEGATPHTEEAIDAISHALEQLLGSRPPPRLVGVLTGMPLHPPPTPEELGGALKLLLEGFDVFAARQPLSSRERRHIRQDLGRQLLAVVYRNEGGRQVLGKTLRHLPLSALAAPDGFKALGAALVGKRFIDALRRLLTI